jgi:hypothetical protein
LLSITCPVTPERVLRMGVVAVTSTTSSTAPVSSVTSTGITSPTRTAIGFRTTAVKPGSSAFTE